MVNIIENAVIGGRFRFGNHEGRSLYAQAAKVPNTIVRRQVWSLLGRRGENADPRIGLRQKREPCTIRLTHRREEFSTAGKDQCTAFCLAGIANHRKK